MKNAVEFEIQEKREEAKDLWGYAVCFGTVITFIAGIGHINSFGLIYKDFIIETNSTAKSLTTAHGVFSIMLAVGGLTLNVFAKNISLRLGGIIGATAFSIGALATIAITNINQLTITFGVLQGIGFGMMTPVCYSTINSYFTKKRTTVLSIIKTVQGLVVMWYPQLIKQVKRHFGFRGTLLIIFGISLHTLPGMLVMKTKKNETRIRAANNVKHDKKEQKVKLMTNETDKDQMVTKGTKQNLRTKLLGLLNLKVLKDPVYRNICFGQSFVNFSDLTFFILLPMLLFQYRYDTSEVATCLTICAGADVGGRCLLTFISSFTNINTRVLFYFSTLITFFLRIVILQIRNYVYVVTVAAMLGVMRAWVHVSSPLVISNHVSHEDFPAAYALFMLAAGLVNVTCSPVIGLLKDLYGDYIPAFYALALCCLPCLLTWPIEYFYNVGVTL